jgi:hypothetical protein
MDDLPVEYHRGEFLISTDRNGIDAGQALSLLQTTHWGAAMTRAVLERAIAHSVCFGLHQGKHLVGFGRAITDSQPTPTGPMSLSLRHSVVAGWGVGYLVACWPIPSCKACGGWLY